MSTRTLRAVLDPDTTRRFGRATLNKLDGPLGWPSGRAWRLYLASNPRGSSPIDDDDRHTITLMMEMLNQRVAALEDRPGWAAELFDVCRELTPEDRSTVLALAHRLHRGE